MSKVGLELRCSRCPQALETTDGISPRISPLANSHLVDFYWAPVRITNSSLKVEQGLASIYFSLAVERYMSVFS